MNGSGHLFEKEMALVEEVFLRHEMGSIPDSHVQALRGLRQTHGLGLVSNVWSRSGPFMAALDRKGLKDLFDVIVFSSDHGCIKPSSRIFEKALEAFDVDRSRIVMVGDSHKRDVGGAKGVGLSAVLIAPPGEELDERFPVPDLVIGDLRELVLS